MACEYTGKCGKLNRMNLIEREKYLVDVCHINPDLCDIYRERIQIAKSERFVGTIMEIRGAGFRNFKPEDGSK